jgi:HlyD family secretion protein
MDTVLEKRGVSRRSGVIGALVVVAVGLLGWQLLSRAGSARLTVDPQQLTTAVVGEGEFLEYYPFDGAVEPATSVYLDVEEGGRVDAILAEGGQHVGEGDLILRFSNVGLQRTAIDTETQLLYNLDIQRNTQFSRAETKLVFKDSLLDLDHQLLDAEKKYRRYDDLMKSGNSAIPRETFETAQDGFKYLKNKRDLLMERIKEEDILSERQIAQAQESIDRLNTSMALLGRIVKSLEVRAPISGYLSTIDAHVGQNIAAGQRIGQIDLLDKFKIRLSIDQYYISRVVIGTPGRFELDGQAWNVRVQKVYPEVRQNAFEADVAFVGPIPNSLKRGQTVTVELTFGAPSRSMIVAKGGFYQQTAGRWVYRVAQDGRSAQRVEVRLGRQNPRQVEVLDGLHAGDRIITSSYETFNGVDKLQFKEPLGKEKDKS